MKKYNIREPKNKVTVYLFFSENRRNVLIDIQNCLMCMCGSHSYAVVVYIHKKWAYFPAVRFPFVYFSSVRFTSVRFLSDVNRTDGDCTNSNRTDGNRTDGNYPDMIFVCPFHYRKRQLKSGIVIQL